MRSTDKYLYLLTLLALTILSGCGSSGANPVTGTSTPGTSSQSPAALQGSTIDGTALYTANCARCHGAFALSSKAGVTISRLQNAISSNAGGMGWFSGLSVGEVQAIVAALTPSTQTPTTTPTPAPVTPTAAADGAALYTANCDGCHGSLASSSKSGITVTRLQNAISSNTGGMGSFSGLTVTEIEAIVAALTTSTPVPSPAPVPTPVSATPDGASLYSANCAACHGQLATSAKAGVSVTRIQNAINGNTGGMGFLSTLASSDLSAITTALATSTPSPTPTSSCGSCHAIPPANGRHAKHVVSEKIACATCHGTGYSTTTVNAATHNNGVKNIDTVRTGWNTTTRTCANSCHGKETW